MSETLKQKALRKMYPLFRKLGKSGKNGTVLINENDQKPGTSFYELQAELGSGKPVDFSGFPGRKVMLVNTASDCGYTGQYDELQSLHERMGDLLQIVAFPSNDFANQEKGSDDEISEFCRINYGVTFPVARKGEVLKSDNQQPVFQWLTSPEQNGWNDHAPDWNFSKYLIDETGTLTHYFGPSVSPLDDVVLSALEQKR
ncbi:MAG: glutathione peroxidase [Balneolia bacterium]|nr:glutathione peroxidase [Balneolia bacterium]